MANPAKTTNGDSSMCRSPSSNVDTKSYRSRRKLMDVGHEEDASECDQFAFDGNETIRSTLTRKTRQKGKPTSKINTRNGQSKGKLQGSTARKACASPSSDTRGQSSSHPKASHLTKLSGLHQLTKSRAIHKCSVSSDDSSDDDSWSGKLQHRDKRPDSDQGERSCVSPEADRVHVSCLSNFLFRG